MKLYCECGNIFRVTKLKDERSPNQVCPMCRGVASTEKPKAEIKTMRKGSEVNPHQGRYVFRTSDGMGGKVPRRNRTGG